MHIAGPLYVEMERTMNHSIVRTVTSRLKRHGSVHLTSPRPTPQTLYVENVHPTGMVSCVYVMTMSCTKCTGILHVCKRSTVHHYWKERINSKKAAKNVANKKPRLTRTCCPNCESMFLNKGVFAQHYENKLLSECDVKENQPKMRFGYVQATSSSSSL